MHKRESILTHFYRGRQSREPGSELRPSHSAGPQRRTPTAPTTPSLRPVQSTGATGAAVSAPLTSSSSSQNLAPQASPAARSPAARPAAAPAPPSPGPVGFKIRLETPPAIMYGTPQESVGALISGICDVDLTQCYLPGSASEGVNLQDVSMSIVQNIKYTTPPQVAKKLAKGTEQQNVLATWDILRYPHILRHANFEYPFSHLLPGTLPPTSRTPLFSVSYEIRASATTQDGKRSTASLPLQIGRSVINITDKTSVRIFPPTTLSLSMILPSALFPNSQVHAEMRIEGLVGPTPPGSTLKYKRWLLKRLNWRVDEFIKVRWGERPEDEYEHKQPLGFGVHKSGWKSDYTIKDGVVEFDCAEFCPGVLSRASKDMNDPVSGISVSHQLICELLIAEEVVSKPTVKQGVLSGSARVLRMQFALPVVDRPGLGISWEDEVPPMYADIPLSPPQYNEVADLPALEEYNGLVFSPSFSPMISPTLRHVDPQMRPSPRLPPRSFPSPAVGASPMPPIQSLSLNGSSPSISSRSSGDEPEPPPMPPMPAKYR